MKKIKRISVIVSLVLCISMLFSGSVLAQKMEQAPKIPPIYGFTCHNGCAVQSRLVCNKEPVLEGTNTHKYDFFTKECTRYYYEAKYLGFLCPECGYLTPPEAANIGDGTHNCFIIHDKCSKDVEILCKHGQIW